MQGQAKLAHPFDHPLSLRSPPLCDEIELWLIADEVDLEAECRRLHERASPPYWAFCWGAGQALARWLLDHPDEVVGRQVVDFGAGSGIVGIAAARAGARSVVAVDVDPEARAVALANAETNGVRLAVSDSIPETWDLLLASDVLYENALRAAIDELQERAVAIGASLLVGEPERPGNAGYSCEPLVRCKVRTFPDVDSPTTSACVYRLA